MVDDIIDCGDRESEIKRQRQENVNAVLQLQRALNKARWHVVCKVWSSRLHKCLVGTGAERRAIVCVPSVQAIEIKNKRNTKLDDEEACVKARHESLRAELQHIDSRSSCESQPLSEAPPMPERTIFGPLEAECLI